MAASRAVLIAGADRGPLLEELDRGPVRGEHHRRHTGLAAACEEFHLELLRGRQLRDQPPGSSGGEAGDKPRAAERAQGAQDVGALAAGLLRQQPGAQRDAAAQLRQREDAVDGQVGADDQGHAGRSTRVMWTLCPARYRLTWTQP